MVFEYEYDEDTQTMRVNCLGSVYGASIEDSDMVMARVIDNLRELKKVARIVMVEIREYEYDFSEARMLLEIALAIDRILVTDRILSLKNVETTDCQKHTSERYQFIQRLVSEIKYDPVLAYKHLLREIRHSELKARRDELQRECHEHYLTNALFPLKIILDNCRIIELAKPYLHEYKNRSFYGKIFHPSIRPNFMYTRYISIPPPSAELLERYKIGETDIEIYHMPGKTRKLYHIIPPEFKLSEDEYTLMDTARRYLGRHELREVELAEPQRVRENLFRIGLDMLRDMTKSKAIPETKLEKLTDILTRYTAGLGILELFLQDENVQDIAINSPVGRAPVYIYHGVYQECETNIVPSREDAEIWATRFRLHSGRPLDEANPVLDTELDVPGGRARVAAITRTLSPDGLGFAFRRHRSMPWTFPLFIKNRMFDSFSAGLVWFLIDGARTMLIAGTRSSGKSSFLGSCLVQVMPKLRTLTVEDSVTGDCQIVYEKGGKIEKSTVGGLIDSLIERYGCEYDFGREVIRGDHENIKVFSLDKNGRIKLSEVSTFIRHMTSKDIYEITTRTGKKIKVTGDHSLFTLGEDGGIKPARVKELKMEDYLATPRILPFESVEKENIDVFDYLDRIEKGYFTGRGIEEFLNNNWEGIKKRITGRSKRSHWKRNGLLPAVFVKEFAKKYSFGSDIYYKSSHNSTPIPRMIPLTNEIMEFFGLWLADGCYDKRSVIISVVDEGSRNVVKSVAEQFGVNVKMHSDGFSLMINSSTLKYIMKALGFEGNAYTKRVPSWIYGLDKPKLASLLRGIFSGDGYLAKSEAVIGLVSQELIKDIQTLLLRFGIISRLNRIKEKDKTYSCRISALHSLRAFREIGFLQEKRMYALDEMCNKKSTHDSSDVVPLSEEIKRVIHENYEDFNYNDYIKRGNSLGRQKLLSIANRVRGGLASRLLMLAESDIFWDQIREIRRLECGERYVYDFSVPGCENFVCENILAHNTLELPVEQLRSLGYNIERLKSRSVITQIETELSAAEALRTALRLGDSCLIVGEVRSTEALALYEAMRIGALANLVAGTIHGESAYGVFDRVVNDLGVPPTSFKATDIVLVCNSLKTPDGMRAFRRIVELTEVRKHWKSDPVEEGGFVNLLEYSAKDDRMKPTKTLLTGESVVLNDVSRRITEWKGRWDVVWDNINLRAKILQSLVDYSAKNDQIIEAPFVIESNSQFHLISADVRDETGSIDSSIVYDRWLKWLKGRL